MFQPVELARKVGLSHNAQHTQAGWPRGAARQKAANQHAEAACL